MSAAGQLLIGALIVVAMLATNAVVELLATVDLGATVLCAIFAGLATVTLWAIYPSGDR